MHRSMWMLTNVDGCPVSTRDMTEHTLQQKLIAEFIGTFFLTLTICLTAVFGSSSSTHPAFPIAATLMVMIYGLGHISGAHFNPAVTMGIWIRGACEKSDVLPYISTQVLAGIAGAMMSIQIYTGEYQMPLEADSLLSSHDYSSVLLAELLFTFALVFVILNVATSEKTAGNNYFGFAIASVVFAGALTVGVVSMASFNPAVSISLVAVGKLKLTEVLWLHMAPQLAGAFIAVQAFKATH